MTSKGVCVCACIIVAVLLTATVEADDGQVVFSGLDFSMTCPEEGTWFYKAKEISTDQTQSLTKPYNDRTKGLYYCENRELKVKYYFYVQGKVCENCIELDPLLMIGAICGDVVFTVLVIVVTYRCSQKRSPAGASFTPKAPAPPRARGPAVQSSEYESLDQNSRSHGTYSKVNIHGP